MSASTQMAASADRNKGRVAPITHVIRVSDLIVHKYAESDLLLKKAHKIAYDLVVKELRPGEFVRSDKLGKLQLFFPNLTPEAGQLRCAVLADRVYRAVKSINPAYRDLAAKAGADAATALASGSTPPAVTRPSVRRTPEPDAHETEMRRQATEAMKLMSGPAALRLEELLVQQSGVLTPEQVFFEYHPVWTVAKKHLTGYRLAPVLAAPAAGESSLTNGIVDVFGISRVHEVLSQLLEAGSPAAMMIPIHFSSLESPRLRSAVIEALATHTEMFRRYLVCDIIAVPKDASRFRLREATAYLKGRCRSMSLRLDLEEPVFDLVAELTGVPVGVHCADVAASEARVMRALERFADQAGRRGWQTYVSALNSRPALLAAIGAGFTYIDGPAVHKPVPSPVGMQRFDMLDLYAGETA